MKRQHKIFWLLLKLLAPLKGWVILAVLLGVATIISGIGLMATSAYLISEAALHPSVAALSVAIVGVRFFGIARAVFRYLERYTSHHVTFRLLTNLRVWFYSALEPLAPARLLHYHNSDGTTLSSGDLLSRIIADIETLQDFYVRVVAPPLVAACVALALWFFLGAFDPHFAFVLLSFFLLAAILVPLLVYLLAQRTARQAITLRAQLHTLTIDTVQGITDLLAFGQEQRQQEHMTIVQRELDAVQRTHAWIGGMQNALTTWLMNLAMWTMLLVAIPYVHNGQLNGVYLALLVLVTLASFEAVLPLAPAAQYLGSSLAAAERLFALVDIPPAVHDPIEPSPLPQRFDLAVHNLRFRYHEQEPYILNDLSLTIPQGQSLALLGPSGAGKSTLAHLLLRFWDYTEGQITLGGHALHDYTQDTIHNLISVVEQDTHLFNTSIRENILLARHDASDSELFTAARQAGLHEFVQSLPLGYDTPVGEHGLLLSGGERQRIAIARALLKDAPLLILDEPTANLDALTEQTIMQHLQTLMQSRTTLLITHHAANAAYADYIVHLRDGKITPERSVHTNLTKVG